MFMNEKFVPLLKNLDLSIGQIKIYICVLKKGLSSVYDISKFTKINRQQIYNDTNLLIEKGILELASKRPKKFLAVSPNKLSKIIEDKKIKLLELENILPEVNTYFENTNKRKDDDFEIKIYEGVSAVKKAFLLQVDSAGQHVVHSLVGDVSHQYEILPKEFWDKNNKVFKEKGGKARMIINLSDSYYKSLRESGIEDFGIETRGIKNFTLRSNFDVWGDYLLVSTYTKVPRAVVVKNKLIADGYKEIFEILWKTAE